jgi:hypothetical protein
VASNRNLLLSEVRTFLRAVPRIGKVAENIGEEPTWDERRGLRNLAFWQVSVPQVRRYRAHAGRNYARALTVFIEGWFPWSAKQGSLSEEGWVDLVDAVMDALGANMSTVGALVEGVEDLEPQLLVDDLQPFPSEKITIGACHHCQITITVIEDDPL